MMYIALALDDEKAVKVVGHSDAAPISNARFASNFELSLEQAKAVSSLLKTVPLAAERVEAEGKGPDAGDHVERYARRTRPESPGGNHRPHAAIEAGVIASTAIASPICVSFRRIFCPKSQQLF